MKCRFCGAPMAKSNPRRGWLCSDCCYLFDATYRERRKAAGRPVSGSKTWDPAKREAWLAKHKADPVARAKAAERMRGYAKKPELRHKHEARGFPRIYDGTHPDECPRCGSPKPELHPALAHEGEVQICAHPWHASTEEGRVRLAKAKATP